MTWNEVFEQIKSKDYAIKLNKFLDEEYSKYLSEKLREMGILKEVNILEYMWAIRLYNYNEDKELVKKFVARIGRELWK